MEDRKGVIEDPGHWIAVECRELGVTTHKVALEAGIAPSTLHRWTNGRCNPYWDAFERVRKVLGRMRQERESGYWGDKESA